MFDKLKNNEDIALISVDNENKFTYSEVVKESAEFVRRIKSRSLVFLLCDNDPRIIMTYVGLIRKKIVVVLMDPNIVYSKLVELSEIYRPNFIISIRNINTLQVMNNYKGCKIYKAFVEEKQLMNKNLAILLTTSGSTGSSKFVRISYDNIWNNTNDIIEYLNISQDEKVITTLPMYYTYGLSIINTHLCAGAQIILSNENVLSSKFHHYLEYYEITSFGGVPYIYEMLSRSTFFDNPPKSIRYITQAGGKLSECLCEKIVEKCKKRNIKFLVMYGQTEATARMAYLPWEYAIDKNGSIGKAIPNGTIQLVDSNNCKINQPYIVGEIAYLGKNVMLGYAENKNDLNKGDVLKGVLHTGDMAYMDQDGFYFIVGRKKRFIKAFGVRISLDEIENILIRKGFSCACVGRDNEVYIFISEDVDKNKIERIVLSETDIRKQCLFIKYAKDIPRTSSGKIKYGELENLLFYI